MFYLMFFGLLLINFSFLFMVSYISKKIAPKKTHLKKIKTKRVYVKFTLPRES
jgi:hypothetical protein